MASRDDNYRRPVLQSTSRSSGHAPSQVQCWIPATGIDFDVLEAYLKDFIDDAVTIKQSPSPNTPASRLFPRNGLRSNFEKDRAQKGYTISARYTLSVYGCQDIIEDSRRWDQEKQSKQYRQSRYGYNRSDVYLARKEKGASPGHKDHRSSQRPVADRAETVGRSTAGRAVLDRQTRDPKPETPPKPSRPPPDGFSSQSQSRTAKLAIESDVAKMQFNGRSGTRGSTGDYPSNEANRGARMQANISRPRNPDKLEGGPNFTTMATSKVPTTATYKGPNPSAAPTTTAPATTPATTATETRPQKTSATSATTAMTATTRQKAAPATAQREYSRHAVQDSNERSRIPQVQRDRYAR